MKRFLLFIAPLVVVGVISFFLQGEVKAETPKTATPVPILYEVTIGRPVEFRNKEYVQHDFTSYENSEVKYLGDIPSPEVKHRVPDVYADAFVDIVSVSHLNDLGTFEFLITFPTAPEKNYRAVVHVVQMTYLPLISR